MGSGVLISGGSGFLGTFVVSELLRTSTLPLFVLMRGETNAACENRLRKLWWDHLDLRDAIGSRVRAIAGDITVPKLGLSADEYSRLAASVDYIVHAAAEIGVNETAQRFAAVNVSGTENMLLFAQAAQEAGGLKHFVHISTAYVAGNRTGTILEDELPNTTFNSLYEQSKHGAEQLVCEYARQLPISIIRPAQIVGDTQTGFAATFNTLYYPLKLYLKGKLSLLPTSANMKVNLIPVDTVAHLVVQALFNTQAIGKTFHAVVPAHIQPSVAELLEAVRAFAKANLNYDPGPVRFLPLPGIANAGRRRNLASSSVAKRKSSFQNLLALAPYFSEDRIFNTHNTENILKPEWPHWQEYLPTLLAYAVHKGFLNHTERTVFEQILVRQKQTRTSITYFDVSADGMTEYSAEDIRLQIEAAAQALLAQGIKVGDRIALTGVNSTRYFIADVAIGLVGAVSVPLYYTSPVGDIVELVQESQAKLMFVGRDNFAAALPQALDIPLVSLSSTAHAGLQSWDAFLESGRQDSSGMQPEVDALPYPSVPFDALATIRYTSGTTGKPKGVMFNQGQLRWMGEVMPSLLDWKTRNKKLRYLSFLPMSHVVEGILVSYAPYYLLSDIEFYYLNDFPLLAEMLPKVRPTLFFSVPRFYEKVWNQFEASSIGKRFLAMPDGPAKRALAKVARVGLLRKAGLDNCEQLLVGSAPVSLDLLESFRSLGIEIHNAFGVTEAPLITLSRLGNNELGSVGELLPETEARINAEGEIEVKGPQVTIGYDGIGTCVDSEGYFATGDFGSYSATGKLIMGGRKKELVITSYGKNISPEKVETMLKSIFGVSEALLVGEGRPYVCALLWLEEDAELGDATHFDDAVAAVNGRLSHPEQVKRWVVMETPLSIAEGELTPNLKLRRSNVAQRYADVVDALYEDDFMLRPIAGVSHRGEQH